MVVFIGVNDLIIILALIETKFGALVGGEGLASDAIATAIRGAGADGFKF